MKRFATTFAAVVVALAVSGLTGCGKKAASATEGSVESYDAGSEYPLVDGKIVVDKDGNLHFKVDISGLNINEIKAALKKAGRYVAGIAGKATQAAVDFELYGKKIGSSGFSSVMTSYSSFKAAWDDFEQRAVSGTYVVDDIESSMSGVFSAWYTFTSSAQFGGRAVELALSNSKYCVDVFSLSQSSCDGVVSRYNALSAQIDRHKKAAELLKQLSQMEDTLASGKKLASTAPAASGAKSGSIDEIKKAAVDCKEGGYSEKRWLKSDCSRVYVHTDAVANPDKKLISIRKANSAGHCEVVANFDRMLLTNGNCE